MNYNCRLHLAPGSERLEVTASGSIIFASLMGEIPILIGDPYLACISV
jgi:hypothetical protein